MKRYTMSVKEGSVEWRGTDQLGQVHELPIAIQLDTFMIEEYPPKLVIIDNQTGRILPADRPEAYMFEGVGKTTKLLNSKSAGDTVHDVVGPLGLPSHVERFGTVVVIGGGLGTAIAYPTAKAFKEAGNHVISIIGGRSRASSIRAGASSSAL